MGAGRWRPEHRFRIQGPLWTTPIVTSLPYLFEAMPRFREGRLERNGKYLLTHHVETHQVRWKKILYPETTGSLISVLRFICSRGKRGKNHCHDKVLSPVLYFR